MTKPTREVGVVKSVTDKGFGFIRRAWDTNGKPRPDLFFHAAQCNNTFDDLAPGTRVSYELGEDRQGRPEAIVVTIEK